MKNYFWVVTYEITILEKTFKYKVRNVEAVSSKQAKENYRKHYDINVWKNKIGL